MPPESLDTVHQTLTDELNGASDDDLDSRYIAREKIAHREAVTLFQNYRPTARDDGLRNLMGLALPVPERHRDMVRNLERAA